MTRLLTHLTHRPARPRGVADARGPRGCGLRGRGPRGRGLRGGFTLIELLVTITIFLVLATITLAAVGAFRNADVVSDSARQVQSFVSGARDRAIYTARTDEGPRARGVRLLVDSNLTDANGDAFACTTLQYVESAGYFPPRAADRVAFDQQEVLFLAGGPSDGSVAEMLPPDSSTGRPYGDQAGDSDGDTLADQFLVTSAEREPTGDKVAALTTAWAQVPLNRIFQAGLLGDRVADDSDLYTARVRLPKYANGAGRWYRALIRSAGAPADDEQSQRVDGIARVFLMTLSPAEDPESYNLNAAEEGYVFELRTVPLAGEDPRRLPNDTAIDLRGVARLGGIPRTWYSLKQLGGASDPGTVPVPRGPLDIMFDPSGLVTGPLAAGGLVHLPVVSLEDLDEGSNAFDAGQSPPGFVPGAFLPFGYVGTGTDVAAYDPVAKTYAGPGKSAEDLIVTVNAQTGAVTVAPVNQTDADLNGLADDPLQFAETGLEAP